MPKVWKWMRQPPFAVRRPSRSAEVLTYEKDLKGPALWAPAAGAGIATYAAEVRTGYDKHADFSGVQTDCWGRVSTVDPLYGQRIKDEVNKDLKAKGWQESEGNCDATVFAEGSVHNQSNCRLATPASTADGVACGDGAADGGVRAPWEKPPLLR